ncbi:MAG: DUF7033 domain-containing protein [Chitinophagales bacterium]
MTTRFPTYNEIEDFFYKNYNLAYLYEEGLEDCFVKYDKNLSIIFNEIYSLKPIYYSWKGVEFPVFIHNNTFSLYNEDGKISFDIYLNVFLFLSGWLELKNTARDKHGRFPYNESLQKKYNFVSIPIVNIYFELLYEVALKNEVLIEKIEFKESIIFTHDIDQFRSGWFENIQYHLNHFSIKSLFQIPLNIFKKTLKLKDDYLKGMEKMLEIDEENNVETISFLLMKKSHQNADFDIFDNRFKEIIEKTIAKQEIGIHPSYETFNNEKLYLEDVKALDNLSQKETKKSRQHFLRYNMALTPKIIEKSSIEEDYTLGFAEQYGFRNGIANPFYLYNFETKQAFHFKSIPLVFMDVSLINYEQEKTRKELFEEVKEFLKTTTKDYNCQFSVLFHNSVFSNVKYKGFTEFYKDITLSLNN